MAEQDITENLTETEAKSFWAASLLPPPGGEVVREHLHTIAHLRTLLTEAQEVVAGCTAYHTNASRDAAQVRALCFLDRCTRALKEV